MQRAMACRRVGQRCGLAGGIQIEMCPGAHGIIALLHAVDIGLEQLGDAQFFTRDHGRVGRCGQQAGGVGGMVWMHVISRVGVHSSGAAGFFKEWPQRRGLS